MERNVSSAQNRPRVPDDSPKSRRRRRDLVGTPVFWLTLAVTLCGGLPFALFPRSRVWLGAAALLMWTCFFAANALLSRRTHSVISAPVYLLAAALLMGNAIGLVEVHVWMVWVLGAGIIAANLSERFIGKYL
jgi:predicted anti-sigma-YlaC factor YlaD